METNIKRVDSNSISNFNKTNMEFSRINSSINLNSTLPHGLENNMHS
jgi:hypothetical protein